MRDLPWGTILMVTGIAVLISLMEKTGGLDLATTLIDVETLEGFINAAPALLPGNGSASRPAAGVGLPAGNPRGARPAGTVGSGGQGERGRPHRGVRVGCTGPPAVQRDVEDHALSSRK